MKLEARRDSPLRCAYCHGLLSRGAWSCPGCGTTLHERCRNSIRACPTIGCDDRTLPGRIAVGSASRAWLTSARSNAGAVVLLLAAWIALSEVYGWTIAQFGGRFILFDHDVWFASHSTRPGDYALVGFVVFGIARMWRLAREHLD